MKKFELTPKMARIIYKATHYISVVCGIMGGILAIGAAGTSDFYSEIHQAVPNNQDMKMLSVSAFLFMVSFICIKVSEFEIWEVMYDLGSVPVRRTKSISEYMRNNKIFNRQIKDYLQQFKNGLWGDVDETYIKDNDDALEAGEGRILGAYKTVMGKILIIAECDRSVTTILFAEEY